MGAGRGGQGIREQTVEGLGQQDLGEQDLGKQALVERGLDELRRCAVAR